MARPTKHNVDYFSHDTHMRNDLKIKALRRKYGHKGYSFWNMILEHLGECEYFEYELTEFNIELVSADFDIDTEEITDMIQFCIKLELLQIYNNFLTCDKLTNRLEETVLVKRKDYSRNNSKRMTFGEVNSELTPMIEVNDGINTQSKGKESKGKESKVNESKEQESTLHETKVKCSKVKETEVQETHDSSYTDYTSEPSLDGDGSLSDGEEFKDWESLVIKGLK
jgi:hypothetical protein